MTQPTALTPPDLAAAEAVTRSPLPALAGARVRRPILKVSRRAFDTGRRFPIAREIHEVA